MKKALLFGVVILVTSVTTLIVNDYLTDEPNYPEDVIQTKLHSRILGENREVIIHLPVNYDSTKKYPVIYVLDGSSEDKHVADKFEVLSSAGCAPKAIVVGIPNMTAENRQRDLTPPFMRMDNDKEDSPPGQGDVFLSFIESELIPFIENNYSASQVRLFNGNSRGGLLVMYSLIHKPRLFQARFCYSTPFWRQENILISKVADFLSSTDTLNTFLYMNAGENETENIKNGLDRMVKAFQKNAPVGLVWHSNYTPNAVHQNNARISTATGLGLWAEYSKR